MSMENPQQVPVAAAEQEFHPEAERQAIYTRANERVAKLLEFRREVFEDAGKAMEASGYRTGIHEGILNAPSEYAAFSKAHESAMTKKEGDATLTYEEKAALLYQKKYNEIQREMETAVAALDAKIKATKPAVVVEEPKIEAQKDLEQMISAI